MSDNASWSVSDQTKNLSRFYSDVTLFCWEMDETLWLTYSMPFEMGWSHSCGFTFFTKWCQNLSAAYDVCSQAVASHPSYRMFCYKNYGSKVGRALYYNWLLTHNGYLSKCKGGRMIDFIYYTCTCSVRTKISYWRVNMDVFVCLFVQGNKLKNWKLNLVRALLASFIFYLIFLFWWATL
jgi:hypothetical protein